MKGYMTMKIRAGDSSWGTVVYTIDGNKIRQGDSSWGTVVYTIDKQ